MSPEDEPVGPLQGATCTGDDVAGDPSGSNDPDTQHTAPSGALRSKTVESIWYCLILPLQRCDAKHAHQQPQQNHCVPIFPLVVKTWQVGRALS